MNGHLSPLVRAEEGGRTLIVGSTGFIGRFVADASIESGRPTYLLVRCPSKASAFKSLQDKGATIIYGSIVDQDFMEEVLREYKIEFVISAVGGEGIAEQNSLIKAIKAVGNVKRFLPSEFGHDIDRADPVEPGLSMYSEKRRIRRIIEEAGIPYTYICCNSIAAWPYHDNTHPADVLPPLDCFHIYGDGSVKAYFVAGTDIGKFTIKSLDDERTLNKIVHFQPPSNKLNVNELASLWEEKIGRKLPRVCITEDDLLALAKEMIIPRSVVAALTHDIFIKGCQINYSMNKLTDVEVCSLYPDTPLKTLDESFADFAAKVAENAKAVGAKLATTNVVLLPNNKPEAHMNGILVPNHKTEALPNTKPDSLANMMLAPNNKPEGLPNGISVPNNKPEALTNGILVTNNKPEALPNSKPEALAITA